MTFSVVPTSAAELFLKFPVEEIAVGQQFKVEVYLNTEVEDINAVEAKILYPQDVLKLESVNESGSVVSLWPQKPKLSEGEVYFSGIIPGGYKGENGLLLSLIFKGAKEERADISFSETRAFLNDGKGTHTELRIKNYELRISGELSGKQQILKSEIDISPPEPFEPKIARDENMFGGKWFLVFNAQDKDSGIDNYKILENRKWKIENGNWEIAESPYLLKDQELKSRIYVKAVDKSGNERIAEVLPQNPPKWYENYLIFIIIILGAVIGYALIKKKNKNEK